MPTIAVSEAVKRKLNLIKSVGGYRSVNEILERLIVLYEKTEFLRASKIFREKLKENKLKISDLSSEDFRVIILGEE
ncbi:MAG: hypothetical protein ACTSYB_16370 [Candidatus Helarchaeota archaeon]